MRHLPTLALLIATAALSACQSVPQSMRSIPVPYYDGRCFHRPFDAGLCEQPNNFWVMDAIFGGR